MIRIHYFEVKNYFESWKGNIEQLDDVLVLWFRIPEESATSQVSQIS